MNNKDMLIILATIIIVTVIIESVLIYSSSLQSSDNAKVINNTTNDNLNLNQTNETQNDEENSASSSSSDNKNSASSLPITDPNHYKTDDEITIDPNSYNGETLYGTDSEGNEYYWWAGKWRSQYYMNHYAEP